MNHRTLAKLSNETFGVEFAGACGLIPVPCSVASSRPAFHSRSDSHVTNEDRPGRHSIIACARCCSSWRSKNAMA